MPDALDPDCSRDARPRRGDGLGRRAARRAGVAQALSPAMRALIPALERRPAADAGDARSRSDRGDRAGGAGRRPAGRSSWSSACRWSAPSASISRRLPARPGCRRPVLLTFEDLSEQRVTERMRVDFVANASHELRTPLASLLGFVETLQGPARNDAGGARPLPRRSCASRGCAWRAWSTTCCRCRASSCAPISRPTRRSTSPVSAREIVDSLTLMARERDVTLSAATRRQAR